MPFLFSGQGKKSLERISARGAIRGNMLYEMNLA